MPANFLRDGQLDIEPLLAEIERVVQLFVKHTRIDVRHTVRRATPAAAAPGPNSAAPRDAAAENHEPAITVEFSGPDEDILLTHNAEALLAFEHVLHRWLNLPPHFHDEVRLDCAGWRAQRMEELKLSAKVAAQRVRETGQPFRLNPMSSRERRIVHLALTGAAGVRTASEGTGDRRQVVIYPNRDK